MWPQAFQPLFGNTGVLGIEQTAPLVVAASTTVASGTLPGQSLGDPYNNVISIDNITNGWAFCNFGDVNVAAATLNNGIGVPPNSFRIVAVLPTVNTVSVILNTAATSGNVKFTRGFGIS